MSTIGIFAGRGDVLVAMALAMLIGVFLGWQARRLREWAVKRLRRGANA